MTLDSPYDLLTGIKPHTPPIPQKGRPIGLVILDDNAPKWGHVFHPLPEELTYSHPTRATIHQAISGGWVDDFGTGLVEINMSGHTAWNSGLVPGELAAYNLRDACNGLYHQLRDAKKKAGTDPDKVEMLFIDTLNVASYKVYPVKYDLKRHKTRPLLYQYQLKLVAIDDFFTLSNLAGSLASKAGSIFSGVGSSVSSAFTNIF